MKRGQRSILCNCIVCLVRYFFEFSEALLLASICDKMKDEGGIYVVQKWELCFVLQSWR